VRTHSSAPDMALIALPPHTPVIPERGLKMISTLACSALSLDMVVSKGPYTAASTQLFSCVHWAEPSALLRTPVSQCSLLRNDVECLSCSLQQSVLIVYKRAHSNRQ
jgi:hypothetical protein